MRSLICAILILISNTAGAFTSDLEIQQLREQLVRFDVAGEMIKAERIQQAINQRVRWKYENGARKYVIVNVAAQRLQLIQNGSVILDEKVIVGRDGMETPSFTNQIESIVFNPVWNIPPDLAADMLPQMKDVGGWNGYTVFVDGVPTDVNLVDPNSNYRIVQDPSEANALGKIKFNSPNKYGVYIHDTPSKHLFDEEDRRFSAGCIRLNHAEKLAAHLLRVHANDVKSFADTGAVNEIVLRQPLKVFIVNWDVWIDADGVVQFRIEGDL